MSHQFIMPKQIFYGEGALEQAAAAIAGCGKKALIVTGPVVEGFYGKYDVCCGYFFCCYVSGVNLPAV